MRMSFFETEKSSSEPGGCRGLQTLLIERTAEKLERASKNKLKKFLTNEKFCDKINELIRVGTAEILDN